MSLKMSFICRYNTRNALENQVTTSKDRIRGRGSNDKIIKTLNELKMRGVSYSLRFSINQVNKGEIEEIVAIGKRMGCKIDLAPTQIIGNASENLTLGVEDVADVVQLLGKIGIKEFRIMRYVPTGKDDKEHELDYERFRNALSHGLTADINIAAPCSQKHCFSETDNPIMRPEDMLKEVQLLYGHCNAGLRWMAVGRDGGLKICPHSGVNFGNIKENSIKETWKEKIMPFVVDRIVATINERCRECILLNRCKGGCHLGAVRKT